MLRFVAAFALAFVGLAHAGLVEVPFSEYVKTFDAAVRGSQVYSGLDADGKEVALRGAAAWYENFYCPGQRNSKVGERLLEYGTIGNAYTQKSGKMYPHIEAQLFILGLLVHSSGGHADGYACRLANDIVGK